jgi:hypothetical protein
MQCADTCVAAKAQCVPAESRIDSFMRHIDAGQHKWHNKQRKGAGQSQQQQQVPEAAAAAGQEVLPAAAAAAVAPAAEGPVLLLGKYPDAQQWLVEQVLPGLERHPHLVGLLALLRKWTSRKVEGVSDVTACLMAVAVAVAGGVCCVWV